MTRTLLRSVALALLPVGLAVGVVAQDKAKKSSHERLQPGWNTLDLTEEQREKYDRVVRDYKPKIDKLESELDALKEKRRKEWHTILTSAQEKKLEAYNASRGKKKGEEDKKGEKEEKEEPKAKKGTKKPSADSGDDSKDVVKPKKGSKKPPADEDKDEDAKPPKRKPSKID
jgi:Spy/CpxP family protein refolding chaperone